MGENQLREVRMRLVDRREDLRAEEARLVLDLASRNRMVPDPADQASLICDSHLIISRRERVRTALSEVNQALKKIERGEYGICQACSDDIGLRRLLARPDTELCIACQEMAEYGRLGHSVDRGYDPRSGDRML